MTPGHDASSWRERLAFLVILIMTSAAVCVSVVLIFMPEGTGWWYWERGIIYAVFALDSILVALTVVLRLTLARRIPLLLSSPPMLGLASYQTWIILHYARIDLPFNLGTHYIGAFLLSPLFLLMLGILGFRFSWRRVAAQNDPGPARKWFCIMPFSCLLALSVAALLRGLIYYWDDRIMSIPASILWAALAAMILVLFSLGGRRPMKPDEEMRFSRIFLAWIASTPLVMAVLFMLPRPPIFPLFWVVTMCATQFSAAATYADRLIRWPSGRLALKAAFVEGFLPLPLWLLVVAEITMGPLIY